MQEYLDGAVRSVPSVEFSLNVDVDGDVIETIIKLSSQYPQSALPEVYLRSSKFSRSYNISNVPINFPSYMGLPLFS